jgi:hypothetical protein
MHKVLGDMIRIQLASRHKHDDPINDLTSAAAYAIRAAVHGTTKHTPSQLVYTKDMILRTKMEANVKHFQTLRENAIYKNNQRENKRRIKYKNYKEGDQVLVLSGGLDPKLKLHQGPYKVLSYDKASGTLHIQLHNDKTILSPSTFGMSNPTLVLKSNQHLENTHCYILRD